MYNKIENWHIVATKEEMIQKATEILAASKTEYQYSPLHNRTDGTKDCAIIFGLNKILMLLQSSYKK
jgi:hypothetical protein